MAKRARDQDGDSPKKGNFSTAIKRLLYGAENYNFLPRASKRLPDPLLNKESYKEWSVHIKNYLSARDLWNVVENDSKKLVPEVWKKKNDAAFSAILRSCGTEAKDLIQDCSSGEDSARDAWDRLADEYDNSGVYFQVVCVFGKLRFISVNFALNIYGRFYTYLWHK